MLSHAHAYNSHRTFQSHETEVFLSSTVQKMDWSRQDHDIVMDVGCGSGDSSRNQLLPSFPGVKKLIAIDILPDMIEFAKANYAHEKIEYHVADIGNWETLERWTRQMSKVLSIFAINWLKDQEEAFKNIFNLLKPGGEAALIFVLSTKFWESYQMHMDNPKWGKYLQNATDTGVPDSHHKKLEGAYYRDLLEGLGFNVVVCEDEDKTFAYANDDHCRGSLFISGLTKYIPDELKSEFKEDLFRGFLKFNGRDSDGKPVIYFRTLTLLVQRPNV